MPSPASKIGKSTLAFNLAGALAERGPVALVDEDSRVRSCLQCAELAPLPFEVLSPEAAAQGLKPLAFLIVNSEGRPSVDDLRKLVRTFETVLMPCGASRLEIQSTLNLWRQLRTGDELEAWKQCA
ncbi:hypothetical protein [Deinococcus marmoris]|uniref:Chromosome partitioning protein, ParA family n=1 Tax=Deinococcus marmoris TaxID=249408 RepID=A0A1U7NZ19_9DEIO|nr:hypothetical protein [Deinococcus marmoris]OLV18150.1 chromosome partitioning protein, ParA family [Deinococcus marmoris]